MRGRRVSRGAAIGGGGAIVVIIVALVARALGVDVGGLFGSGGSSPAGSSPAHQPSNEPAPIDRAKDPDAELVDFVDFVINDIQSSHEKMVAEQHPFGGEPYRRAKLVIFTEAVETGCGVSSSAIGPFYCPPDERAYIDLSFYRELKQRFGAPGDFAQAYVLAHELGHHLQTVFGIDEEVARRAARDRRSRNALSVRQELQADCFAGVWAASAKSRNLLEMGDAQEALDAATAIGDDRLQNMAGRKVNPETWTHGSSQQRVKWFQRGLDAGRYDACDTFAAKDL